MQTADPQDTSLIFAEISITLHNTRLETKLRSTDAFKSFGFRCISALCGTFTRLCMLLLEALEADRRILGQEHPDTLTSIANLASTYRNQGRWKEAEDLEVLVMETSSRVLGQEHPSTLTSIANLASTFWNQGRWKEAEDLEVLVMETRKRVLGQEHPDTLTSMNNLAWTWKGQNRDAEALDLVSLCLEFSTSKLGANHPNTLACTQTHNNWSME